MARLTSVISLRDNYSAVMQRVKKNTDSFNRSVQTVKKQLDAEAKKQRQIRINNSPAMKAIKAVEQRTKAIRNAAVVVTAHAQRFSAQIKPAVNTLKWMTKAPFKVSVRAVDMASTGLRGLTSIVGMLSKPLLIGGGIVAAGGIALIKKSLEGASMLERQMISMTHFLGVNNPKQGKSWAGEEAQRFIADLRKNADITPFDTDEVISTGTRALGIAGGKTKPAMSLLRLAEDMTALTPGKTLSDSIEALADLATGETERMKEFGFKISQAQIKASGGDWSKLKNGSGIGLTQMFRGGADKLGQSAYGLWSTVTGTMSSGVTNMGTRTLEYLKPELKRWADYLSGGGATKMFDAGSKMMASLARAVVEKGKSAWAYVQKTFIDNPEFQNMSFEGKVKFGFAQLRTQFEGWYEKEGKAELTKVATRIGDVIGEGLKNSKPIVDAAVVMGTNIGKGIMDGLVKAIWDNIGLVGNVGGAVAARFSGPIGLGISTITTGIQGWKDMFSSWKDSLTNGAAGWFGFRPTANAWGKARVPYDNYPTLLHQGEQVLTAQEANQRRSGGGGQSITVNIHNPVVRDESDFQRLAQMLRQAIEQVSLNGGAVHAD
ncbi:hypothetical protein [Paenibacillus sp. RUD330]|uniref:hypothetical protein n=1 Tax=Paenibacillus sp. RUD330 TaxID=2023772 RepID=UPI000B92B934|nr:hypothetical protein [Paenibacillus sp. RUD330]ASS66550.1 hypothetical protein CIC07_10555 [Paenibacillus sp. RUD330]